MFSYLKEMSYSQLPPNIPDTLFNPNDWSQSLAFITLSTGPTGATGPTGPTGAVGSVVFNNNIVTVSSTGCINATGTGFYTFLSATITPTSTSSYVKITATSIIGAPGYWISFPGTGAASATLFRGSQNLAFGPQGFTQASFYQDIWPFSICYVDSPATTSATTYSLTMNCTQVGNNGTVMGYDPALSLKNMPLTSYLSCQEILT